MSSFAFQCVSLQKKHVKCWRASGWAGASHVLRFGIVLRSALHLARFCPSVDALDDGLRVNGTESVFHAQVTAYEQPRIHFRGPRCRDNIANIRVATARFRPGDQSELMFFALKVSSVLLLSVFLHFLVTNTSLEDHDNHNRTCALVVACDMHGFWSSACGCVSDLRVCCTLISFVLRSCGS